MVKRTGPTSKITKALVHDLEKHSKKEKKAVFDVLATALMGSTRTRAEINLHRLETLAKQNAGKILVVPGKVLGTGEINSAIEVAAFRYSGAAKNKITAAKGKAHTLSELIEKKMPANKLVLVK